MTDDRVAEMVDLLRELTESNIDHKTSLWLLDVDSLTLLEWIFAMEESLDTVFPEAAVEAISVAMSPEDIAMALIRSQAEDPLGTPDQ